MKIDLEKLFQTLGLNAGLIVVFAAVLNYFDDLGWFVHHIEKTPKANDVRMFENWVSHGLLLESKKAE